MRDPNRIDGILDEIKKIWKLYPDMRLGQLIGNVHEGVGLYYIEDNRLIKDMKEVYNIPEPDPEPTNIVYGKVKRPDGTWEEDRSCISRKFKDEDGEEHLKACFACKKAFSCTITKLDDCVFEQKDEVVLVKE